MICPNCHGDRISCRCTREQQREAAIILRREHLAFLRSIDPIMDRPQETKHERNAP